MRNWTFDHVKVSRPSNVVQSDHFCFISTFDHNKAAFVISSSVLECYFFPEHSGERCMTSQKTAAKETTPSVECTLSAWSLFIN